MNVPIIYDVTIDRMRPVTQEDVDQLSRVASAQSVFRKVVRELENKLHQVIVGEITSAGYHALMHNVLSMDELHQAAKADASPNEERRRVVESVRRRHPSERGSWLA